MRKLLWLVALIGLFWVAWWWAASSGMQRGVEGWLDDRRAAGWQAEAANVSRAGFPMRLHVALEDMRLADPATGVAADLPQLDIETPIYWPGYVTVTVPPLPITLAAPDGKVTLTVDDAVARMRLHPGTTLELEQMGLTTGAWTVNAADAPLLAARDLAMTMVQAPDDPATYQFDINAAALTPGPAPRRLLRLPADWPRAFDSFAAEMTVTFDRPWDRSALEQRRPQPRQIALRLADAKWDRLHLLMAADISVDAEGRGTGKVSLKADNWPAMLDMAEAAGLIPQKLRAQTEAMVENFARLSGDPNALDVTISLDGGRMSLGIIPLGQAPLLMLR